MHTLEPERISPYLDRLRELTFVREVSLEPQPALGAARPDALLTIQTPHGLFKFAAEIKRTYLDRAMTSALIARHGGLVREHALPLLLLARYIPRPTGERLVEAGVNFVDRQGNIHLMLGDDHHVLLLGHREPATQTLARRASPALVQFYFLLLAEPDAVEWSVRRLAEEAGIGKTTAATARQRLAEMGVLGRKEGGYRLTDSRRLEDDFLRGYAEVLRPHLEIGRFRGPQKDRDAFLQQLARKAETLKADWAVTGAPAAYVIDHFYRGEDVPVFVEGFGEALRRTLRLVPDREGPVTLLRCFGRRWKWRKVDGVSVAHPWLVFAELIRGGEPRELEAAELIRQSLLTP